MLAKCVSDNHRDWDEWLPQIAFSYNACTCESCESCTPFFLMHGTVPRWDVHFKLGVDTETPYSVNDYVSDLYDQKVKVQEFTPGDIVYVLNLRLYQWRCPK